MFARRIQIAKFLLRGYTFNEIKGKLRVGLETIKAVDFWLSAKLEDYRVIVPPLLWGPRMRGRKAGGRQVAFPAVYDPNSWRGMSMRYPAQFALFNTILGIEVESWTQIKSRRREEQKQRKKMREARVG